MKLNFKKKLTTFLVVAIFDAVAIFAGINLDDDQRAFVLKSLGLLNGAFIGYAVSEGASDFGKEAAKKKGSK